MKIIRLLSVGVVVLMCSPIRAQDAARIEQLQKQMETLQENFSRIVREQNAQIEALKKQLADVQRERTNAPPAVFAQPSPAQIPPGEAAAAPVPTKGWSPSDPIRLGSKTSYLDLSFDGLFAAGTSTAKDVEELQFGGHDPKQRGFTVQNLETTFAGAVDPYFRGQANIIFQTDTEGESFLEVEEAYLQSSSLPAGLQLKAGQFFTEFGRHNQFHPHAWSFADQPLVIGRFLGPDGLRNAGARLSWLAPTPFYSELYLAVQNSQGETAFSFRNGHEDEVAFGRLHSQGRVRSFGDMLFVPRYTASFDLTDEQTLVLGTSAAFGPNGTVGDTDTQIYGADAYWKWKPVTAYAGFPFISFQTEALLRRYQAGSFTEDLNLNGTLDPNEPDIDENGVVTSVPRETFTDYGAYAQLLYGFRKGWVAGFRGDYVWKDRTAKFERLIGPDPLREDRWRLSPNLTWYPTEFSKFRLQYNLDHRQGIGYDHSVWLQFEFLLGSHAAHKF